MNKKEIVDDAEYWILTQKIINGKSEQEFIGFSGRELKRLNQIIKEKIEENL